MKAKLFLVIAIVAVVLSGCFGAGLVPDPDGGEEPLPPDFSKAAPFLFDEMSEGHLVLAEGRTQTPYGDVLNALWWASEYTQSFSIFDILADWTPEKPSTYFYLEEGPQVDWTEITGGYEWIFSDAISLTLTNTGSEISVLIEDLSVTTTVLSGTVAYDAMSGSVTVFGDGEDYDYSWGPSTVSGFEIRIEITYVSEIEVKMVIDAMIDGSEGEYELLYDGTPDGGGSWPQ